MGDPRLDSIGRLRLLGTGGSVGKLERDSRAVRLLIEKEVGDAPGD
jgi:hypothetical protein